MVIKTVKEVKGVMPSKKTLQEILNKRVEENKDKAYQFEEDKAVIIRVINIRDTQITKDDETWITKIYRAELWTFSEQEKKFEPKMITFYGSKLLDSELTEGNLYIVSFLGKEKDYNNYYIESVTFSELKKLAGIN